MRLEIISESTVLHNEIVALSRYVKSLRSLSWLEEKGRIFVWYAVCPNKYSDLLILSEL